MKSVPCGYLMIARGWRGRGHLTSISTDPETQLNEHGTTHNLIVTGSVLVRCHFYKLPQVLAHPCFHHVVKMETERSIEN